MSSIVAAQESDLGIRIAERVRGLRSERGYSLDMLAARSGVSRSAISMIERQATSPTAVVLERIATGLNVPLASLFDPPTGEELANPVSLRRKQHCWKDPQSGYTRRNISPPRWDSPIQIVEVVFPPNATVSYETTERDVVIHQQVWVLTGRIDVTRGPETHNLETGDCVAMMVDQPITFSNPYERQARYTVVIVSDATRSRRVS